MEYWLRTWHIVSRGKSESRQFLTIPEYYIAWEIINEAEIGCCLLFVVIGADDDDARRNMTSIIWFICPSWFTMRLQFILLQMLYKMLSCADGLLRSRGALDVTRIGFDRCNYHTPLFHFQASLSITQITLRAHAPARPSPEIRNEKLSPEKINMFPAAAPCLTGEIWFTPEETVRRWRRHAWGFSSTAARPPENIISKV